MRVLRLVFALFALVATTAAGSYAATDTGSLSVTRATLSNGLRVVVVHNPLAPVVTTTLNYEAGSAEQTVAGIAFRSHIEFL